jgi:asparagine synthetase B (glutamine-hydrolysing)
MPDDTVLGDSIGGAVWFAARGHGVLESGSEDGVTQCYTSPARVLLLGMGADEQCAGYSKHRGVFGSRGYRGLEEEVSAQVIRISERNMGRDDRVTADHGVSGRFPFLDERVVTFLSSLPIQLKADMAFGRGVGEKLLLRATAYTLQLPLTAAEPKRAIQFGSRIAKTEDRKVKGHDKAVTP